MVSATRAYSCCTELQSPWGSTSRIWPNGDDGAVAISARRPCDDAIRVVLVRSAPHGSSCGSTAPDRPRRRRSARRAPPNRLLDQSFSDAAPGPVLARRRRRSELDRRLVSLGHINAQTLQARARRLRARIVDADKPSEVGQVIFQSGFAQEREASLTTLLNRRRHLLRQRPCALARPMRGYQRAEVAIGSDFCAPIRPPPIAT